MLRNKIGSGRRRCYNPIDAAANRCFLSRLLSHKLMSEQGYTGTLLRSFGIWVTNKSTNRHSIISIRYLYATLKVEHACGV